MAQVLVVDDDQPTRDVLRLMMEDAGHQVAEAPNGAVALDMLRASPARMVALIDHLMPGMDGIGVLAALARDPDLAARHACVLMTADARPLDPSEAHLLTTLSVPLVYKPFDMDMLLDTVSRCAQRLVDA